MPRADPVILFPAEQKNERLLAGLSAIGLMIAEVGKRFSKKKQQEAEKAFADLIPADVLRQGFLYSLIRRINAGAPCAMA